MKKIVRINMASGETSMENLSGEYAGLGGRGLTSTIVAREVPPLCHALGPQNKLVVAPGLLAGTSCINCGRLSIGAKSPLTGTIKESNVGGTVAQRLGQLQIAALVFEQHAPADKPFYLLVNHEGTTLHPADDLKGLKTYDTVQRLRTKHGDRVGVAAIGPVGEMRLATASVAVSDRDGHASRHAGRGGMGAVMGSKGLKAIVVDAVEAPGVEYQDREAFKAAAKILRTAIVENEATAPKTGSQALYSMNAIMAPVNELGGFPTHNFTRGKFADVRKIDGDALHDTIKARGGVLNHSGCSNCIIQCSNVFVDPEGQYVTSALEYETLFALGANCDIGDLDAVARMDRLCDEYGIDTMETGCSIALAMEAGVVPFGDTEGAIGLLHEIGQGTPLGRILGNGAAMTGQAYGLHRIPVVKRQAFPGYDPRVLKGLGVTYASSPMGADHTAGFAAELTAADMNPEGRVALSLETQVFMAFLDSIGLCLAVLDGATDENGGIAAMVPMVNAVYGWDINAENYGRAVLKTERAFNTAAGFTPQDDRLPEWLHTEPLPPNNTVFDVSYEEMDAAMKL